MPYLSTGSRNMRITTATRAGAPLATTRAGLEVQRVAPDCHGEVEGELYPRGPVEPLHLPVGRLSNLVFKFRTSSRMSQSSATTSYSTSIRPRDGHMYETSVTYKSGLFTIDITEISPARASRRRLPRQDIASCAAV
jgi:hypothetical protein